MRFSSKLKKQHKKFQDQLNKVNQAREKNKEQKADYLSAGKIMIMSTELVALLFVGVFIGLYLDDFFTSKPIILILCLIISIFAFIKKYYSILKK